MSNDADYLCRLVTVAAVLISGEGVGRSPVFAADELQPAAAQDESANSGDDESIANPVATIQSLDAALKQAVVTRTPVFVIAGATWCGPCKQLEKEMEAGSVVDELGRWIVVHIDVDHDAAAATKLAVSSIPALRVLSPDGRLVASDEGVRDSDSLLEWLKEAFLLSTEGAELTNPAKLTSVTVRGVLRSFRSREASVREAAITRLAGAADLAATHVVAEFPNGTLSERLAWLELLTIWGAPVEGLDPWVPETVTTDRIKSLEDWLEKAEFPKPASAAELSHSETLEALRMLRLLRSANPSEATAIREQLARMGRGVLPLIREAMEFVESDDIRAGLAAARYRVAAADDLTSRWPGGIERLASPDLRVRVAAVNELGREAVDGDEDLLAELVSDPTPLIREMSLEALSRLGAGDLSGPLARLIEDPDLNVRAAVLKHLAVHPLPGLVPHLVRYIQKERDTDLVVHAVRGLAEIQDSSATIALVPLLEHASWRVRAEAASGINGATKRAYGDNSENLKTLILPEFVERLDDEDGFVVGRILEGLPSLTAAKGIPILEVRAALGRAVERHPALARPVFAVAALPALVGDYAPELRRYTTHADPEIRGAAIVAIVELLHAEAEPELIAGLKDSDSFVRVSSLRSATKEIQQTIQNGFPAKVAEVSRQRRTRTSSQETPTTDPSKSSNETEPPDAAPPESESGNKAPPDTATPDPDSAPESNTNEVPVTPEQRGLINSLTSGILKRLSVDWEAADPFDASEATGMSGRTPDADRYRPEDADAAFELLVQETAANPFFVSIQPLIASLASEGTAPEQLYAALFQSMYGDEAAFSRVLEAAKRPDLCEELTPLLTALPWKKRLLLFQTLSENANSDKDRFLIRRKFVENFDLRSTVEIWQSLADPALKPVEVVSLFYAIALSFPGGSDLEYSPEQLAKATQNELLADARAFAKSGKGWQQIAALMLLQKLGQSEETAELSRTLVDDHSQSSLVRSIALRFDLFVRAAAESEPRAVALLKDDAPEVATVALSYLSLGMDAIRYFGEGFSIGQRKYSVGGSSTTRIPQTPVPPDGLTINDIQPFTDSDDENVRADAWHLLALLKNFEGLPVLIEHWRADPKNVVAFRRLYRALVASEDASHVPLLEDMYESLASDQFNAEMADFYWTIRSMSGEEIGALRKRIRDEQDANKLK
jgi:HEAT repeat protein/thiol-disulfide isomerase/thioredoxin